MDYDGNDFQSQNFQLSGEDNNRFSSGLRSFSLPKIELDEHFQVHLRFDSLVEPESLLGIQDQEGSSWIEEFSSGNTALEFTAGATESCSISRRKNVWSEATSSESVEILLRSVGEDDVIAEKTTIFSLDAHNGLGTVNNHMDPGCVEDVSLQLEEAKNMNADPSLPPDQSEKDLPRLNKDMTADLPDVQDVSNTFNGEELGSRIFEEIDKGTNGEKADTGGVLHEHCDLKEIITSPMVESISSANNNSNGLSTNDGHLDGEFVEKNASNDHPTSATLASEGSQDATMEQIDASASCVNVSPIDSENLSAESFVDHVTESYPEDVLLAKSQDLVAVAGQKMENQIVTEVIDRKNGPSEGYGIKHSLDVPENSSSLESKAQSSSLLMVGCNEHVVSDKSDGLLEDVAHQIENLSKGNGTSGQILTTVAETHALVVEGEISEISPDGHFVKICSSDSTEQSISMQIDSLEPVKEGPYEASLERKVSLEKHNLHAENVSSMKNREDTGDCEGRKVVRPVNITEEKKDAGGHPSESTKNVEIPISFTETHSSRSTDNGAQGPEEKEDSNVEMHVPELVSQVPESAGIQKCAESETLENETRIEGGTLNAAREAVQEFASPPMSCVNDGDNVQISHLQGVGSSEKCNAVPEVEGGNSDIHMTLLPEKVCTRSSTSSDNLNSYMKEKPQDASDKNQNTCDLAAHVEGQPIGEVAQTATGGAANCKENSLQSDSMARSSSEPHLSEGGDGDTACVKPSCGSPTIISCTQPTGEVEQQELNRQLSDQNLPVSGDLPQASSTDKNLNKSTCSDPKEGNASEEKSFTFEVGPPTDISQRASVGGWKPFPIMQSYESPQAEERCSTVSGLKKASSKVLNGTSDIENKSTRKDKSRSVSGSLSERSTISKRKSIKETPTVKEATERNVASCNQPVSTVVTISRDMQLEEKYQCPYNEAGGVKLSCASSVQMSNLPDLNTGSALFHQPFTDVQQVQLRAQIFVYGSLIQGIPPDEACMISAFGNTDGTRNTWEVIWRATLERFHSQKSPTANLDTPMHSHSGVRVHEQVSRSSSLQSKAYTTPVSRISTKGTSTVNSNFMTLPSPLWNVSPHDISQSNMSRGLNLDHSQIISPLHGYQSSHGKQYTGSVNPWLPQASPVPWVASSPVDTRSHFSVPPIAETVQVTPIRDASVAHSLNLQFLPPSSFPASGVPLTTSATTTVHVQPENKTSSRTEKHASANQKTRKRRKSVVSEAPAQVLPASQPRTELDSATAVTKQLPASIDSLPAISSTVSPTHFQIIESHGKDQRVIFSEETCSKIEQAKLQAEDAAAFAAAAIRHTEGIWSQLSAQKNSGIGSDIETKLASAAVAAAAASSVAKAAAAAAKVASDAAMQAKMMADEALSSRIGNSTQAMEIVHTDRGTSSSRATTVSGLKGKDKTSSSSSVISAAKEAARRRVEAASAASKRAENLDAIVKAAELAAIAICQAGTVISMGDPLPFTLSDLIDAGPEGFWKAQRSTREDSAIADSQKDKNRADGHNEPHQGLNSTSLNKNPMPQTIDEGDKSSPNELRQSTENQTALDYDTNHTAANLKEQNIQEGSLVEVLFDESSSRRVWYSAKVLSLENGKAYVCSNDSHAGSSKRKEWISLEGEVDKPPRIRIAHPTTAIKYEGTRKRRRAALGNYVWAVGDRVDAWTNDGWCEGVVTEKIKDDETKLTVCFSAGGDMSIIRAWHLRPSFIWKDGQWVEWSRPRENTSQLHEGDTPYEKRQKLNRPETEVAHEVKNTDLDKQLSANFQSEHSRKPEDVRPLLLSEKDKVFSVGKNVRVENDPNTLRVKRLGQKEGSRVIFGVPKPGKKRKFIEVSKHYVTGKIDNVSEGNDAIKHTKYLPPQTSSGWKNTLKADPKGRKIGEPKPKVARPVKPQSTLTRSATEREGSYLSSLSTSNGGGTIQGPLPTSKAASSHEEKSEKITMEAVSFTNSLGLEESTVSESSMRSLPGIPTSKKKTFVAIESDVGTKGKVASAFEKTKNDEKQSNLADHFGKTIPDAIELRRSNRRIQPTSRLLEGLQSSMIISKIPSVSHEKGARASHRNAPSSSKGSFPG